MLLGENIRKSIAQKERWRRRRFQLALPFADKLYITLIDDNPDADTFFPLTDNREWQAVHTDSHPADDRHAFPYTFIDYIRRK